LKPDALLIDSIEGAVLYKAYCATCHGTDGKGNGPMSEWLKTKTPDLTHISIRAGSKFPLARVQQIISGQANLTAGHGTREMPVWGPIFSQVTVDQDLGHMRIYNLAKFIENMQDNSIERRLH
jgi:mono/diheme cytochrome c family protein